MPATWLFPASNVVRVLRSPKQHWKPVAPGHMAVQRPPARATVTWTSPTWLLVRGEESSSCADTSLYIPALDYTSTEDTENPNLFTKY